MGALAKSIFLFGLNLLDAQLTIFWVRNDFATEGNGLMARLLDMGDAPFFAVKLLVGAFAAYILYRFSRNRMARHGLTLALGIYICLMVVHAATGLSALGWRGPENFIAFIESVPNSLLAIFG